jgi:hypothetical protein
MVHIDQKRFFEYIQQTVNPERVLKGLEPIDKGDAIKAYWILCHFFAKWQSK